MNKEISYKGYTARPSDYDSPDGDLALSLNLINEGQGLAPIADPKVIMKLGTKQTIAFIHKTSLFTHYIICGPDNSVSYIDEKSSGASLPLDENFRQNQVITHFNAVGNTLLAFTQTEIIYFLWKDSSYIHLGNHIPDIDISFGLIGRPRLFSLSDESKRPFTINFDGIDEDAINNEFSENNKSSITEQVMAKVNKFIREQTVDKGRFCFPFFVRYALRLFDGSLVNHSAPILMNPSTSACPIVFWKYISGKKQYTDAELDIMLLAATLDYKITARDAALLDNWKDIVSAIDIFISRPIYTFDQEGKCTSWMDTDNFYTKFIGRLHAINRDSVSSEIAEDKLLGTFSSKDFLDVYSEWPYSQIYSMYFSPDRTYPAKTLHLPEFSDSKVNETIRNTSTFYKLKSFDVSQLNDSAGKRNEIVVEDEYLQSLVTREAMTDDYLTHDQLAAENSYSFNNRLNLSGVYRMPFRGFFGNSMFAFCNKICSFKSENRTLTITPLLTSSPMTINVYIRENGREYLVSASDYMTDDLTIFLSKMNLIDENGNPFLPKRSWGCYVFYPNVNAHKMVISSTAGSYLIPLKPHEFLNGAFALLDYELVREPNFTNADLPSLPPYDPSQGTLASSYISQANKVFTSEVNNPFYFPLQGINSVGTGKIMGICSAAKALSQGQFGQFPLYAFTDEGIWAMEIDGNGLYKARQPITRDVCSNPDAITQLDKAVLFPTARGLMLLSGSQTECISDVINSEYPFNPLSLPGFAKLHASLLPRPSSPVPLTLPLVPFSKFLEQCRMIYDYVHQRLIVYAPGITYAYVFSLKSKMWGMTLSNIESHLNSYPLALAVDSEGNLVSYSEEDDDPTAPDRRKVPGLFLTRPLKLDAPDIYKTVETVIQRGFFRKGNLNTVLYGSRDLIHWHLVWSSRDQYLRGFSGSPYKYFRIAGATSLLPDEKISGASVSFQIRLDNQLR